jgi:hypothetical protein
MSTHNFILSFIESCVTGRVQFGECGPVWQIGVLTRLLLTAIVALLVAIRPHSSAPLQKTLP